MSEENKKEEKNPQLDVYEMLIKQQHLILQQSEQLSKERETRKAEEDEIDLRRLIPNFLRKKREEERGSTNKEGGVSPAEIAGKIADTGYEKTKGIVFYVAAAVKSYLEGLKRFMLFVAFSAVLGLSYGLYIFMKMEKVYESRMIIDPGNLEQEFYFSLLEGLDRIARNNDKSELIRKLGLEAEIAKKVTRVHYSEYWDYQIIKEEATDSTDVVYDYPFFTVTINITDNSVLLDLETAIFQYLEKNDYTRKKREIKKELLKQDVAQFDQELQLLDSLKQSVINRINKKQTENDQYFVKESPLSPNGIILSQDEKLEIEPMQPFNESQRLYKEKAQVKEELLNLGTDFLLIDGFSAVDRPIFPRIKHILWYMFLGFIGASGLTFFMALVWKKRE